MKVMIAGIAGASLGTEIAKSLRLAGGYTIYGCDISGLAYGHFDPNFTQTDVLDRDNYITALRQVCAHRGIDVLIAGAEKTMSLISAHAMQFEADDIQICQNNANVVEVCSHKARCFEMLAQDGIAIPKTRLLQTPGDLDGFKMPCIIKPATDSGGSAYVFFAATPGDAKLYCSYLIANGQIPVAQSYVPHDAGEFTIGVLSLPDGSIAGSIALRRSFESKLSVSAQGDGFLISSGISQGEIRNFARVRRTAETIARAVGSTGPLNIQGRIAPDGKFMPFEINPRFSASTYLRAMAGFNEIDYFIKHVSKSGVQPSLSIREGWYMRSLDETFTEQRKDIE
ncbi:ATP-grasp domain-containing protein [uncultured Ruegeria sp.]|uniref:ATP-grasp domain-containing protein n=1 Tax=uncultured Ruegeria sp. TaxID=259304 RepID=UPI00263087D5|nr:ATP-grasp domain-containing protein [uncultured Ruegeria sp.]